MPLKSRAALYVVAYAVVAVALWATAAYPRGIWVDPAGTDSGCTYSDTDPGSNASYRPSINSGCACAAAGDTVNVRPGLYTDRYNNNCPSGIGPGQETIIRSTVKHQARQLFTCLAGTGVCLNGWVAQAQYFITEDMWIDGANMQSENPNEDADLIKNNPPGTARGIIWRGNLITNSADSGLLSHGASSGAPIIDIIIEGNEFRNCGQGATNEPEKDHCLYFTDWSQGSIIRNNIAIDSTGDCYDHRSSHPSGVHQFYGNYGEGCSFGILVNTGPQVNIYNNVFVNNRLAGIYLQANVALQNKNIYNNSTFNNTATANQDGIRVSANGGGGTKTGIILENNSMVGHTNAGIVLHVLNGGSIVNPVIRNNVSMDNAGGDIVENLQSGSITGQTYADNKCETGVADCTASGLVSGYRDPANGDLHLTALSSSVNAGRQATCDQSTTGDADGGGRLWCDSGAYALRGRIR